MSKAESAKEKKLKAIIGLGFALLVFTVIPYFKILGVIALFIIFGLGGVWEFSWIGPRVNPMFTKKECFIFALFFIFVPFTIMSGNLYKIGWQWTIFVAFNCYATDVGAWIFGSFISPKVPWKLHIINKGINERKSWEAAILGGGTLSVVLCIGVVFNFMPDTLFPDQIIAIPFVIAGSIAAICGDTLESWLKRKADIKDSGKIFGPHGGFLDRTDSLLGTIYVYMFAYSFFN